MLLEIPRRKNLHYRNLALSTVAVAVIAFTVWNRIRAGNSDEFFNLIMVFFVLLNIGIVINAIRQILKKTPALVINDEGIIDNTSPANMGLIKWGEITFCEVKKYRGSMQLLITITDNQRAIVRANRFNTAMIQKSMKDTGAAIVINCDTLQYNRQVLADAILDKIGRPRIDQHLIM